MDSNFNLFEMLEKESVISKTTRKVLETFRQTWGCDEFRAVVDCHILERDELATFLADHLKLSRVFEIDFDDVDPEFVNLFSVSELLNTMVLPVSCDPVSNKVHCIIENPWPSQVLELLSSKLQRDIVKEDVVIQIATAKQIEGFIARIVSKLKTE